jgi:NAD(P)-dependent dehydrogenase (short-subunit alcohol dehydrogenase family)
MTSLGCVGTLNALQNRPILASDAASYITGHVLHVDGGLAM